MTAEDRLLEHHHDRLTGLPTRPCFIETLKAVLAAQASNNQQALAVIQIGVNRFRLLNNGMGHDLGDQILLQISERLKSTLQTNDKIARLTGDEFGVLIQSVKDETDALRQAQLFYQALIQPLKVHEQTTFLHIRIGVVISYPHKSYQTAETLMRDADIALLQAKRQRDIHSIIFTQTMHEKIMHDLQLETQLRQAMVENELHAYYQPIYSLSDHSIHGFEVLVRWQHPTRGLLQPAEFIELAEQLDLIREIDLWILKTATRQLQTWRTTLPHLRDNLSINLNLSASHFNQMSILNHVNQALIDTGLPPHCLKLELTETMIMPYTSMVDEIFAALHQRRIRICLDDFGVGYSSLGRLIKLPISTLKIDRRFIENMVTDMQNQNVVRMMINLAHDLNIDVVAEGVTDAKQQQLLEQFDCDYIQGYRVSRPLNTEAATELLQVNFPLPAKAEH